MSSPEERAIQQYLDSYRDLVALAVNLIETDRDLTGLAETIDGMTAREVRSVLKVKVSFEAEDLLRWERENEDREEEDEDGTE